MKRDPEHPIISKPFEYEIVGFNYQAEPFGTKDSFLELTLRKNAEVVKLRFEKPTDIWIERGFPTHTGGLCILDISARKMEGMNVEVTDFESSGGQVHFYAKSVERI